MIFTIGFILFVTGYYWYRQTEYTKDWKDMTQFGLITTGSVLIAVSLLTLAWRYLP